jgi:hypothetical protein
MEEIMSIAAVEPGITPEVLTLFFAVRYRKFTKRVRKVKGLKKFMKKYSDSIEGFSAVAYATAGDLN